nr:hypothetical protein TDPV-168 [Oriental turtle dovepox virus]
MVGGLELSRVLIEYALVLIYEQHHYLELAVESGKL